MTSDLESLVYEVFLQCSACVCTWDCLSTILPLIKSEDWKLKKKKSLQYISKILCYENILGIEKCVNPPPPGDIIKITSSLMILDFQE